MPPTASAPDAARAQREARLLRRFELVDYLVGVGVYSEVCAHVIFGPESGLSLCSCIRCKYLEDRNDPR